MITRQCRPRIVTALIGTFCIASVFCSYASAEDPAITPEWVKPGKWLFADDFERDSLQSRWSPLHMTRWTISFRLSGKMNGAHFGFNDGTVKDGAGHVCRVTFDIRKGTQLIKDKSSKVTGDSDEVLDTSDVGSTCRREGVARSITTMS